MKSLARQQWQPCVLGRYPQPVFLYPSASNSGPGRGSRTVGAQVVGGTARGFQRRRGSISGLCPRGRRRSCVIGVGPSKQDHADLRRHYHASHSPSTLRSKIRPFADCRLERAPPHRGIRLNSNSPLPCESCESGERRGRKKMRIGWHFALLNPSTS